MVSNIFSLVITVMETPSSRHQSRTYMPPPSQQHGNVFIPNLQPLVCLLAHTSWITISKIVLLSRILFTAYLPQVIWYRHGMSIDLHQLYATSMQFFLERPVIQKNGAYVTSLSFNCVDLCMNSMVLVLLTPCILH